MLRRPVGFRFEGGCKGQEVGRRQPWCVGPARGTSTDAGPGPATNCGGSVRRLTAGMRYVRRATHGCLRWTRCRCKAALLHRAAAACERGRGRVRGEMVVNASLPPPVWIPQTAHAKLDQGAGGRVSYNQGRSRRQTANGKARRGKAARAAVYLGARRCTRLGRLARLTRWPRYIKVELHRVGCLEPSQG